MNTNNKSEILELLFNTFKTESKIYIYQIEPITQSIIFSLKNEKSLKCKEIAEKLNVSLRTIYHYQNKTRPISTKNLFTLINLLDKNINQFNLTEKDHLFIASDSGSKKRISKIPLIITPDLLYITGYLFGDGCLHTKNWTISFVDEYREQIEKIDELIKNIFKVNTKIIPKKGKCEFEIYSKALFKFFNKIFDMPIGTKKGQLHIPKILDTLPNEYKLSFLSGLFDADAGTLRIEEYSSIPKWFLKSPNIEFVQADCEFVCEVKNLCKSLDLYTVGPYFNRTNGGHRLFFNGRNSLNKCQKINFFRHPIKQKRLALICEQLKLRPGFEPETSHLPNTCATTAPTEQLKELVKGKN